MVILLALGGYFYFSTRPELPPKPEPQLFAWLVEPEELRHIEMRLSREDKSQAFIKITKEDKFPWYFDDPQRTRVSEERWGGGVPLLLSGPGVQRVIKENATEEQLTEFGLTQPRMEITLTLEDGDILNINVGDSTPDGNNFYIQAPGTNDVATVDFTWYEVLERLVKEPPYVPATE